MACCWPWTRAGRPCSNYLLPRRASGWQPSPPCAILPEALTPLACGRAWSGLLATWQRQHWSLQPGVRFSQQGAFLHQELYPGGAAEERDYRFNYLSVPLTLAYAIRSDGQGLQVFAGPYVSMLVGGSYRYRFPYTLVAGDVSGQVRAGGLNATDAYYHTQRVDAGLQAGVGYRFRHLLAQASGSLGLRNLAATTFDPAGNLPGSPYYSRSLRLSIAYLFQPNS